MKTCTDRSFGPSRVVQWSEDEAYSFLAQRMDDIVMNHPLAHHQSSDESTASSCHVHLSLNQRSARAALKATALHREEAIQAIENESQQMIRNHVFSAPMTLEDIPEEYQNDVLRTFLFVVDKYDAGLTYVKSKARIVADGSSQALNDLGDKLEMYPHSGDGLKLPTQESSQVPLNDVMRQKQTNPQTLDQLCQF